MATLDENKTDHAQDDDDTEESPNKKRRIEMKYSDLQCTDNDSIIFENGTEDSSCITLVVDGRDIVTSKAVLAIASPVFKAMFQSEFREKSKDKIELPEKKFEDVVDFLRCIYPNIMEPVTENNVYRILPLADEYQVEILKKRCPHILIDAVKENSTPEEVYKHLYLAEKYNIDKLRERCIYLASELKMTEMNTLIKMYPVSRETQMRIKDLALERYQYEKQDSKWISQEMNKHSMFRSHILSRISDCSNCSNNSNLVVLKSARILLQYFNDSSDESYEKDSITKLIRKQMHTFDATETHQFNMLPDSFKRHVRGKDVCKN